MAEFKSGRNNLPHLKHKHHTSHHHHRVRKKIDIPTVIIELVDPDVEIYPQIPEIYTEIPEIKVEFVDPEITIYPEIPESNVELSTFKNELTNSQVWDLHVEKKNTTVPTTPTADNKTGACETANRKFSCCNSSFLCPHDISRQCFSSHSQGTDYITDTYLQPFDVREDADMYLGHSPYVSADESEDEEEHNEQCEKILKFEKEFALPSTCQPVSGVIPLRRSGIDHNISESEIIRHRASSIPAESLSKHAHKKHHKHHKKHYSFRESFHKELHRATEEEIKEETEQVPAQIETDKTDGKNVETAKTWTSPNDVNLLGDLPTVVNNLFGDLPGIAVSSAEETPALPASMNLANLMEDLPISETFDQFTSPIQLKQDISELDVPSATPKWQQTPEKEESHSKHGKKHHHHHHHHRHHHRRKSLRQDTLESRIRAGMQSLEQERSAIRSIVADIDADIKGDYDSNEVADITNHRMDHHTNVRHISHVSRPPRGRHRSALPSEINDVDSITGIKPHTKIDLSAADQHVPHEGFVELEELTMTENSELQWKERARWIKYEEDVEKNERWGKPHVASLSFHSLLELRRGIETGTVLLNLDNFDLPTIFESVVDNMVITDQISQSIRDRIIDILLSKHCHHHQNLQHLPALSELRRRSFSFVKGESNVDSAISIPESGDSADEGKENVENILMTENGRSHQKKLLDAEVTFDRKLLSAEHKMLDDKGIVEDSGEDVFHHHHHKPAVKFGPITEEPKVIDEAGRSRLETQSDVKSRIPVGAEGTSVLVGTVNELERQALAFVRLSKGCFLGNLSEVSIPVRFIFIILGPPSNHDYYEIGRSIATLMSDKVFHDLSYEARNRDDLLSAINSFLDDSIVLAPGEWDRHLLLPLLKAEITAKRKQKIKLLKEKAHQDVPDDVQPFKRMGRPFGGLLRDIQMKSKFFASDIIDGFNMRCFVSIIFIFFATLAPTITFGGLLSKKTNNAIGVLETLLATSICGIIFSLTSGQPLIIMGTTGPILVFEELVYGLTKTFDLDFLVWRMWIGIWVMLILWIIVAAEGCFLVEYFTRFTEEVFSVLISTLFIYEAIKFVETTFKEHPLHHVAGGNHSQYKSGGNSSEVNLTSSNSTSYSGGILSHDCLESPNVALLSTLLVLGTFFISYYLRKLRFSHFLSSKTRRVLSDFGVPIAMVSMCSINVSIGIDIPKITMPHKFRPTDLRRHGFIVTDLGSTSVGSAILGILPAVCVSVLLFMEAGLTGVLLNKGENKLKKGGGYNLDLFSMGLCTGICSVLGLPWMCPAPVRSVQHQKALAMMSRTHAPGEKPYLLHIKEQRLTNLSIHILMGFSMLAFSMIEMIPLAVCLGVFLYLGVSSLSGIQFMEQMKLIFVPTKYHPNRKYVRNVKFRSLISYTVIQIFCLAILIVLKMTAAAPGFPFFLISMVGIRKLMSRYFDEAELEELDNEEEEDEEFDEDEFGHAM